MPRICSPDDVQSRAPGLILCWRTALVLAAAVLLLGLAGVTFWYQDIRYSLPTHRPTGWKEVSRGQTVVLPSRLAATRDGRPLLLHFFNPDCPCSRFNAEHVRALRQRFGDRVHFVAVAQVVDGRSATEQSRSLDAIGRLFGPDLEATVDEDGSIAAACGVYSTPQAVIVSGGPSRALLFRGNYSTARYCTTPETEFVRLALEALVNGRLIPPPTREVMVAYGCELPTNTVAVRAPTSVQSVAKR